MARSTLSLPVPADYILARDACSYGYFLLAPNYWHVPSQTLWRVIDLPSGPVRVGISQVGGASGEGWKAVKGKPLSVKTDRAVRAGDKPELVRQLTRMLRLDEQADVLAAFHKLDGRWKRVGSGRLFRSPTMWEDVVKTITSCNVAWPNTMTMNYRLCEVFGAVVPGGGAGVGAKGLSFPTAEKIAKQKPLTLRTRCRVGYRDARIVALAKMFVKGEVNPAWFEDPATPDEAVREALIELPGIGPYAAHNIMQLLGRYGHLPLDSESVRHAKTILGYKGPARKLMKKMERHYAPFGPHKFRSYWFELWDFYQAKRGKAHTWDRETTGRTFTAAMLAD
jgi:3-methyladenine DNA glycosylase/8-oxoguanine DNA glycosylase